MQHVYKTYLHNYMKVPVISSLLQFCYININTSSMFSKSQYMHYKLSMSEDKLHVIITKE